MNKLNLITQLKFTKSFSWSNSYSGLLIADQSQQPVSPYASSDNTKG